MWLASTTSRLRSRPWPSGARPVERSRSSGDGMTLRPLEYAPTMPNLIRRAADAFLDREFVLTTDGQLTFAEAERQSRLLAKRLLREGVTKGTRVGILFPQGPEFVVALFAATSIGAVAGPRSTFFRAPELRR